MAEEIQRMVVVPIDGSEDVYKTLGITLVYVSVRIIP
jgi:hypothetical protein